MARMARMTWMTRITRIGIRARHRRVQRTGLIAEGPRRAWLWALLLVFALSSALMLWARVNPLQGYYYLLLDPLTSRIGLLEVLVKATPLLFCAVSVALAFSVGYANIGVEGQLYAGAISAAWLGVLLRDLPPLLLVPLMAAAGCLAGMLWALLPALLKLKLAVNEVITTLLLNSLMGFIVSALLHGSWRNPRTGWPQSPEIAPAARWPTLLPRSRLHLGFVLMLSSVVGLWFLLSRTRLGLQLRAVGLNEKAARLAGIRVGRTVLLAALISGAVAGLAGVSEVAGLQHHLIADLSPGYGYTGILVATLGGLHPLGMAAAGFSFGLLDIGALNVGRALGVPVYLGSVMQAGMLLIALSLLVLQRYRRR